MAVQTMTYKPMDFGGDRAAPARDRVAEAEETESANLAYLNGAKNAATYDLDTQDAGMAGIVQRMRGEERVGVPNAQTRAQTDMTALPKPPAPAYAGAQRSIAKLV
jgi:hypothetical protein